MRGSFFIGKLYRRCFGINDLMINEEIRDREVRVVDQNGEQLGVMSGRDALALAEERQLDLVKIAPQHLPQRLLPSAGLQAHGLRQISL